MAPILIAVCLSLSNTPGEEKEIDFPQKTNARRRAIQSAVFRVS